MDPAELTKRVDELASTGVKVLSSLLPVAGPTTRGGGARAPDRAGHDRRSRRDAISGGDQRGREGLCPHVAIPLELAPPEMRAKVAAAPFGPPRIPYYEYLASLKDDDPALARYAATLGASGVMLIPTLSLSTWIFRGTATRGPNRRPHCWIPLTSTCRRIRKPASVRRRRTRGMASHQDSAKMSRSSRSGTAKRVHGICRERNRRVGHDAGNLAAHRTGTSRQGLPDARQALAAATANVGTAFAWRDVGQVQAGIQRRSPGAGRGSHCGHREREGIDRLMVAGALIDRAALLRAGK